MPPLVVLANKPNSTMRNYVSLEYDKALALFIVRYILTKEEKDEVG